ncbi:hypothetical protein ABIE00_004307 [Arthrobacter sp. OAP107]
MEPPGVFVQLLAAEGVDLAALEVAICGHKLPLSD